MSKAPNTKFRKLGETFYVLDKKTLVAREAKIIMSIESKYVWFLGDLSNDAAAIQMGNSSTLFTAKIALRFAISHPWWKRSPKITESWM